MKAASIQIGKLYEIAVGRNTTTVKVVKVERRGNEQLVFECKNTKTGKPMLVTDAKRFLKTINTAMRPPSTGHSASFADTSTMPKIGKNGQNSRLVYEPIGDSRRVSPRFGKNLEKRGIYFAPPRHG